MSEPLSVPRAARHVRGQWKSLANVHGTGQRFHATLAEDLPLVARRWIVRAVVENTPLARAVRLEMRGQIRLRDWRPFTATQLIAPGGRVYLGRYGEGRGSADYGLRPFHQR
ncbi:DUF6544 family protein [Rhodococcus oxybenzonivorans]|uniref:DUF6544 family protein n=1 Tax=Rhodococcus oxybenzonivorans TaxID=1990687 RepID=UPI001E2AFFD3|nr:DUF6544 family protein [Rhodococcus oxybenzonivorans]